MTAPSLRVSPLQVRESEISAGRAYFVAKAQQQRTASRKGKERAHDDESLEDRLNDAALYGERGPPALLETLRSISRKKRTSTRYAAQDGVQSAKRIPVPLLDRYGNLLPEEVQEPPDELAWSGDTLVWSKGNTVYRQYSYKLPSEGWMSSSSAAGRIIQQALFAYFEVPAPGPSQQQQDPGSSIASTSSAKLDSTLLGPFQGPLPPAWSDDNANASATRAASSTLTSVKSVRVLCIRFWDEIFLYYPDGTHHVHPIDFPVKTAWALDRGIMLERDTNDATTEPVKLPWRITESEPVEQPKESPLYVLLDPFDSVKPVAKAHALVGIPAASVRDPLRARRSIRTQGRIGHFLDGAERIIYTSGSRSDGLEPIIVSVNNESGKVSIWAYAQVAANAKAEYEEFKQRVVEQELAEAERNGVRIGDVTSETMREEQAQARLPSAIGKRRRSHDSAMGDSVLPGTDVPAATATSDSQSAAQRRVSALLDRRKSNVNPNASVADFLEAMGTNTQGLNAGSAASSQQTNGDGLPQPVAGNQAVRRASTALSSAYMDRRQSAARTELSVSLNRMALGSQRKQSLAGPVASIAEAIMGGTDDGPQPGHGEMERDASFVGDEHRQDNEQSDFFMARLASTAVSEGASDIAKEATATMFDIRDGSTILAVLLPTLKTLFLYRISRGEGQESDRIVCNPLRQMEAISIAPVYATRHAQQDVLVLDSVGELVLCPTSAAAIEIDISDMGLEARERIVGLMQADATCVHLTISDSAGKPKQRRLELDYRLREQAAREMMQVLAHTLSEKEFIDCLTSCHNAQSKSKSADIFSNIQAALFPPDSQQDMATDSAVSPWEALLASTTPPQASGTCSLPPYLAEVVLNALHLLGQEWLLLSRRQSDLQRLAPTLARLAAHLCLPDYLDAAVRAGAQLPDIPLPRPPEDYSRRLPPPFDIFTALRTRLARPDPASPIQALQDLIQSYGIESSDFFGTRVPLAVLGQVLKIYDLWHSPAEAADVGRTPAERVVLQCAAFDWTPEDLAELSLGPALPIKEAIRQCQLKTPELWPKAAYVLLGRTDQTVLLSPSQKRREPVNAKKRTVYSLDTICDPLRNAKPMSHQSHQLKKKSKDRAARFSQDSRLDDVGKMLNYTLPVICKLPGGVAEAEGKPEAAQKHLLHLAWRTLAIPFGNAAFMYRALARPRSAGIPIPKVELAAKLLPLPGPITISSETLAPEEKIWPYFHSGVAVALHIAWAPDDFDSSEFALHKPSELNARHAGFLLGLGLTGQARSLGAFQAFKYMDPKHEYTSVGLLLGLGAAYRGTGDPRITSALSVHISALHPATAGQLNLSHVIQSSALVGVGLVHIGSQNRKIADNVLRELSRFYLLNCERPDTCRDGYALASGICYGLVMLGTGNSDSGSGDPDTLRTFKYLLEGGRTHSLPGARKTYDGVLDVSVTSPAAAIALALTFMRTNRQDVADMLEVPQAPDRLDHVRSDLICMRTMYRSIIMWDSISSKKEWVESLVPVFVQKAIANREKTGRAVPVDYEVAYWNVIAGGCMAIGFKYAGTAKEEAHGTLIWYLDRLIRAFSSTTVTASLSTKLSKHSLQNCINCIVLAFGSVMAGTGELNLLRRLRVMHGQVSESQVYGTHMASHLALGLLFLGKGRFTLGTSKLATAAVMCAFYPAFPSSPSCNRFHLQAFRHLWALAVEPRCLVAKDIDSGRPVYIPLKFRVKEEGEAGQAETRSKKLTTPTLIPPVQSIESIKTDSPRYWPVNLNFKASKEHLDSFLRNQTIFVKRKAGHLSYAQDARGIRSVFTQAKIEAGSSVSDTGDTAKLLTSSMAGNLSTFASTYSAFSATAKTDLQHFCTSEEADFASSKRLASFSASAVLECLLQDKQDTVAVYRGLYHAVQVLGQSPTAPNTLQVLRNLLFVCEVYQDEIFEALLLASGGRRLPLINRAFLDTLRTLISASTDSRLAELDHASTLKAYSALIQASEGGDWLQLDSISSLQSSLALLGAPPVEQLLQIQSLVAQSKAAWTGTEEDFPQVMLAAVEKILLALARQTGRVGVDKRLPQLLLQAWLWDPVHVLS